MSNTKAATSSAIPAPAGSHSRRGSSQATATLSASSGQNAVATKRSAPPSGNSWVSSRPAAAAGTTIRAPRERHDDEEDPGDRAGQRARGRGHRRPGAAVGRPQPQRQRAEGDAERERPAAHDEVGDRGGGGEPGGERSTAEPADQRDQRRGAGDPAHRDGARRAEQAGQRREQQRVAGDVVAAVPLRVPQREALVVEQPRAVGVRGEVGGVRGDGEPRDRRQRGDRERR